MIKYFCWIILTAAFFQDQVTTQCNNTVGCKECNSGGENCNRCSDGFWLDGTNCSWCPDNCLTCTDNNYCQSCLPKYYGIDIDKCKHSCSASCGDSGCNDVTGDCYVCQAGRYGSKCDLDCGLCLKSNCSSRACILGCKGGYFQVFGEPELSYCQPCIPNCAICSNSTYCTMCNEGFYLTTEINQNGRQETFCVSCSGPIHYCTSCYNQQNGIVCNRCSNGYALSHNQCGVNNCLNHACLNGCDNSGICDGCNNGFWGNWCENKCSLNCKEFVGGVSVCFQNGTCSLGCKWGFEGDTCTQTITMTSTLSSSLTVTTHCPGTCDDSGCDDKTDGKCSYGCKNGYWGHWCENKCSENCKTFSGGLSVCFQNGTCTLGYKDGLDVDNFTQKTSNTTTLSSSVIEIDECESSPCENGATCTDKSIGYSCIYALEYKENDKHKVIIGGLSAAVALLFVALVIHILRSRSKGLPFRSFCCSWQNTNDPTDAYTTLQIQQPSERNEYDVMESNLSVHTGPEPETVQSQSRVEYINTALGH